MCHFLAQSSNEKMPKISRRYLTDIRHAEVLEFIEENLGNGEIDWEEFDCLVSSLPENVDVHFIDQRIEPENWDDQKFGTWFPRRIILIGIPSMHSSQTVHKVVLTYVPTSEDLPPNFVNRLGFTQPGIERLVEYACIGNCRPGLRLNGTCAHVCSAILLLAVHAFDPNSFRSTHKPLHYLDVANPDGLDNSLLPKKHPNSDSDYSDSD